MQMWTPRFNWLGIACLTVALAHVGRAQVDHDAGSDSTADEGAGPRNLPAGYLGITFRCRLRSHWGPDGLAITHYGYPAVASIERGSPAARAGIQPGDTILAYGDRDVRNREIVLNQLLQPNTLLPIKIKRNGQVREVTVSIARRPRDFVDASETVPSQAATVGQLAAPGLPPDPPLPPHPSAVPGWTRLLIGPRYFIADDGDLAAIDGAQIVRTTSDLREALGISSGLLVVSVESGTPAAGSSLRAGDVIVSAGGDAVTTPRQLVRTIERAMTSRDDIPLEVERQHKTRRVVLQW